MKIQVQVSLGLVGCKVTEVLDVDDDSTDNDLEETTREWMYEQIEWTYRRVDTDK